MRTEFRISARWNLPDPTSHIRAAARKLAVHFIDKPHSILPFEPEARKVMLGNQVAQTVRAQLAANDPTLAALEANAAWQQGVQAGLVAALDFAAGGGKLDEDTGLPMITVEHVQCARRLVDISVEIRKAWRAPLDPRDADETSDNDLPHLARAVLGHYPSSGFGAPLSTQPPPAQAADAPALVGIHPPVVGSRAADAGADGYDADASNGAIWRDVRGSQADEAEPAGASAEGVLPRDSDSDPVAAQAVRPVLFHDLPALAAFDDIGFGEGGAMIFSKTGERQLFKDREFLRRFLLSGKSHSSISHLVDNYLAPGLVVCAAETCAACLRSWCHEAP